VRPTVEQATAASTAFGWAFRGDLDHAARYMDGMDEQTLAALRLASALIAAHVDRVLGTGPAWTTETQQLIVERLHDERCREAGCLARSREEHDATVVLSTLNDLGLLRRLGGAA
jgi:hypothetical protein